MTRYLLRGPSGYVGTKEDWTQFAECAQWWTTSEAAHLVARQWLHLHKQTLSVVVRDGNRLNPLAEAFHRGRS